MQRGSGMYMTTEPVSFCHPWVDGALPWLQIPFCFRISQISGFLTVYSFD